MRLMVQWIRKEEKKEILNIGLILLLFFECTTGDYYYFFCYSNPHLSTTSKMFRPASFTSSQVSNPPSPPCLQPLKHSLDECDQLDLLGEEEFVEPTQAETAEAEAKLMKLNMMQGGGYPGQFTLMNWLQRQPYHHYQKGASLSPYSTTLSSASDASWEPVQLSGWYVFTLIKLIANISVGVS